LAACDWCRGIIFFWVASSSGGSSHLFVLVEALLHVLELDRNHLSEKNKRRKEIREK
jgi:hypothetical protein